MSAHRRILVESAIVGSDYRPTGPFAITIENGRITALSPLSESAGDAPRLLAMPALANAHDHARPLSTTSFGAAEKPLESWLPRLAAIPPVDPYLATAAALGRAVAGGCGAVMIHLTRPMGLTAYAEEARAMAQAAQDVGVPIALAVAMKDRNPLVYGDHSTVLGGLDTSAAALVERTYLSGEPDGVAAQIRRVEETADALAGQPVDVQFGPTGVQWCSLELLEAIAAASTETGRRVHMHLLETRYQREWADRTFPQGIAAWLDSIGLLSPRLTLAHCVWARDEELDLIAERGARIALNASSNLHLRSGIAPAKAMLARGVDIALGIDGCALDEDDDSLRELRLLRLLNAGTGFATAMDRPTAFRAACRTGRAALGLAEGGVLDVGAPADIMLLDLDRLDRDHVMAVDPWDYVFARGHAGHVAELIVGGRTVSRDGAVTGVDLPSIHEELRAAYRLALPASAPLVAAWDRIEPAIAGFYRDQCGCC